MTCASPSLWPLLLLVLSLVALGVLAWLYGQAQERLRSYAVLDDTIKSIDNLDAAMRDMWRFLRM